MSNAPPRTVESELRRLFPEGTRANGGKDVNIAPVAPIDVFAAAAHLLETSGAYQYLAAPFTSSGAKQGNFSYSPPSGASTRDDIERWRDVGRQWLGDCPQEVKTIWARLWKRREERLVVTPSGKMPAWWKYAHALLVIGDEASVDLGYSADRKKVGSTPNATVWFNLQTFRKRNVITSDGSGDDRHFSRHSGLDSMSRADRDVARVFPKGRTTEIGCSFRTFSHNLALLPPHGNANTYWHVREDLLPEAGDLNLLAIPFPYHVPAGSFVGSESDASKGDRRWGRYRILQKWLNPAIKLSTNHDSITTKRQRESFISFVDALIREAQGKGVDIHGVILPEYALDWKTYDAVARHLRDKHEAIEFLVSGVSVDCNGNVGNMVTYSVFHKQRGFDERIAQTYSRGKHHRWLIDRSQIEQYDLAEDLDPNVEWWEYLKIGQRSQHIDVFRDGSTLTAVICEDLARVEPGLSQLRCVGPNIVFALLMDGPQIQHRWPGIYATNLTDDPGSSVLTVTSLGLVDRSNKVRSRDGQAGSRSIALWRNRPRTATGHHRDRNSVSLELAEEDHLAVVLKLKREDALEVTMDGRANSDAAAWYYSDHFSFGISDASRPGSGWDWIISGGDPAHSSLAK